MPRPRIVIALDPERVSPEAIELGHALALATGAPLTLLAVWRWWEPVELAMLAEQSLREEADEVLRSVGDRLRARGHSVDVRVRAAASIGGALHDAGRRGDTGLIVLGPAHHGPAGRVLAGSSATDFLHGAPCPVVIPPRRYLPTPAWPRRIGVAYSDSDEGREALRAAAALVRRTAASLRVISVSDTRLLWAAPLAPSYGAAELLAERRAATERAAQAAIGDLPPGIAAEPLLLEGDPVAKLADAGGEVDLLVCGSRAYGPLGALLLGSVSRPLLHRATSPLLVIPRGQEGKLERLAGALDGTAAR
jgi:nucleotide-binding universal stress UspA family protein